MNPNFAVSFLFHIRLLPFMGDRSKGYIFSSSEGGINTAAYVSNQNELVFEAQTPRDAKRFEIHHPSSRLLNKFLVLTFHFANQEKLYLEIVVDEDSVGSISHDALALDQTSLKPSFVIGASPEGRFPGRFDLAEQVVYSRILTSEEHSRLINYFKHRRDNAVRTHVHFDGNAFLVRDPSTGHLTQESKGHQPTYVNK